MTYGKLKELLNCMSEGQLQKDVVIVLDEHEGALKVKDVRILNDSYKDIRYPVLVA